MFADVYPISRLPRRFGAFTYSIPAGLVLGRGSVVRMSLRGKSVHGVVARVHDEPQAKPPVTITEAVESRAFTPTEVDFYEAAALEAVQSVSSILHAVFPVLPKRLPKAKHAQTDGSLSVDTKDTDGLKLAVRHLEEHANACLDLPDLRLASAILLTTWKRKPQPLIIAAPNVRDAQMIHAALASAGAVLVTGEETPLARERAWRMFRGKADGVLVGTSLVSLMPHPAGGRCVMVRAGHENHRREDRNPRFDARRMARLLCKHTGATMAWIDTFNRIDERQDTACLAPFQAPETTIADMAANLGHRTHPLLSPEAITTAQAALDSGKRVLFAYNRLEAEGAKHSVMSLAKALVYIFDRDAKACTRGDALPATDIVVATSHYVENLFDPFHPDGWGAVIVVDANKPLRDTNPRAHERALRGAADWRAVARASKAAFVLQTDVPDLFRAGLSDPAVGLTEEAGAREAYGFPPFGRVTHVEGISGLTEAIGPLPATVRLEQDRTGWTLYYGEEMIPVVHQALRILPDNVRIDTTSFS